MWLSLAVARASAAGRDDHDTYVEVRDAVAQQMTAEQIAEAQRLAREWKPIDQRKPKSMPLEVGSRLGHYDVTAQIGESGMGEVYRVYKDTKGRRNQTGSNASPSRRCASNERRETRHGRQEWQEATIEGYLAKSGKPVAKGRSITWSDGRKAYIGSPGTGALDDPQDHP